MVALYSTKREIPIQCLTRYGAQRRECVGDELVFPTTYLVQASFKGSKNVHYCCLVVLPEGDYFPTFVRAAWREASGCDPAQDQLHIVAIFHYISSMIGGFQFTEMG